MKVLVLGSGGREHALSWKIAQSPLVTKIFIAPGNAGTAEIGENLPLDLRDHAALIAVCKERSIALVVVGPDDVLAEGIVDALTRAAIPVFGPSKAAAKIEWSKAYAKEVMKVAGIPTARSEVFTNFDAASLYVKARGAPIVVKADGLALGKGVTVADSIEEALEALQEAFVGKKFGAAGTKVVIEEFMTGLEVSAHALCAGEDAILFPLGKDHKRIGEGDNGPNTGGMGTIVPVPGISGAVLQSIREDIVLPLLRELKTRGTPFNGLLYPGLMLTSEGPKVIEFNARFGDPETQSYMRLMKNDIVPALLASAQGSLNGIELSWNEGAAACIALASRGYPGSYDKGKEIVGVEDANKSAVVFHAGTRKNEGGVLQTNGGRVLNVTATGGTLADALVDAYAAVEKISFEGMQYRRDIGATVLKAR